MKFIYSVVFILFCCEIQAKDSPVVSVKFEPQITATEFQNNIVEVHCDVATENPKLITKYQWFFNGNLTKETVVCQDDVNDPDYYEDCDEDANILSIQNVTRENAGAYSCSGFLNNEWTNQSSWNFLKVYYKPEKPNLTVIPSVPKKGERMVLNCAVGDLGNPPAKHYRWYQGRYYKADITSYYWIIEPVALDLRENFSCMATNRAGNSELASIFVDIQTPPKFIKRLNPYTGVLFSDPNIKLVCHIECFPICSVAWYKNGVEIDLDDPRFFIDNKALEADQNLGDFESVLSTLHFNLTNWPNGVLDINKDSSKYSCVSTNNSAGSELRSSTYMGVEYPPTNITISHKRLFVLEGSMSAQVFCNSKSFPESAFVWIGPDGQKIVNGHVLKFGRALYRFDTGNYTCIAKNKYGDVQASFPITVLFKPNCTIAMPKENDMLVCEADGSPINYQWEIKLPNETESRPLKGALSKNGKSYIKIRKEVDGKAIYQCMPNNTVGFGSICEIEIFGESSGESLITTSICLIFIAFITALLG